MPLEFDVIAGGERGVERWKMRLQRAERRRIARVPDGGRRARGFDERQVFGKRRMRRQPDPARVLARQQLLARTPGGKVAGEKHRLPHARRLGENHARRAAHAHAVMAQQRRARESVLQVPVARRRETSRETGGAPGQKPDVVGDLRLQCFAHAGR